MNSFCFFFLKKIINDLLSIANDSLIFLVMEYTIIILKPYNFDSMNLYKIRFYKVIDWMLTSFGMNNVIC